MATVGTFYFDTNSFASATTIYDDAALTTVAQNGWYSDGTIVRQQINGVLYAAQSCSTPVPAVIPVPVVIPTPVAPTPVQPQPVPVQPQPVPVQPQPVPQPTPQPVQVQPQPVPVQPQPVPVQPPVNPPVLTCYVYNATNNGSGGDPNVGYFDCNGYTQNIVVQPGYPQSFCATQVPYQGSAVNLTNTQQTC
jgi:outer membrane biosynthesis protein TonB